MIYSKIAGTGGYLPPKVMTNQDWEDRIDTSHQWIVERTGIASRHIADTDETASGMAVKAAQKALSAANLSPDDVQLIIVATTTPDKVFPSTACFVQHHLNVPICIAFDLQAACSGFIYALNIADQFIKSGQVKNALVIGTELMSRLIDWSDRNTSVLFGDGAGAVVLQASKEPGIRMTRLYADGHQSSILSADNLHMTDLTKHLSHLTPTDNPGTAVEETNPFIQMKGKHVFKQAVLRLGELVQEIQNDPALADETIDWLVPHQANIRIIKAMAEKLGLPMSKVICTIEEHANTSSASIPLALDVAVRDGRIRPGHNLIFEAFGAGLTWGSAFITF